MGFKIAIHPQSGCVRRDLSQQSTLDKKSQIVVDRGHRNGWNATPDCGVNIFWRMVPVRSNHGFVNYLTLVRDRQTMLRSQFTELFMGKPHKLSNNNQYKPLRALSTVALTLNRAVKKVMGSARLSGLLTSAAVAA